MHLNYEMNPYVRLMVGWSTADGMVGTIQSEHLFCTV